MSFKKKTVIGFSTLIIVGVLIVGFFGVSSVIAVQTSPNMKAIIKTKNINTINSMNFNVDIEINAGEVKIDNYKNQDIYLSFSNDNNFKLVSATENGKAIEVNERENKIKIENFDYKKSGEVFKAEPKVVRLTFKATGKGTFKGELALDRSIKLNYTDVKGEKIENIKCEFDDSRKSLDIKIDTLKYEAKNIIGFEQELPMEITSGSNLDLEYKLAAGDLNIAYNEKYEGEMTTQFENKKRVIYVVEQSVLDEQSANGESARDSIIMSVESLKQKNPAIQTSLISYGESANIVQSDKKDFYSADELIGLLRSLELKDENGNLGEALKKAKMLANSDMSYETNIILVSAGNPLYITEKNNEMLLDFSSEKGTNKFSEQLAYEYANKIANEIVVDSNDNINWFGVNYGLKTGQNEATEIIDKLHGKASMVKNPYSDDLIDMIEDVVSDFVVKGNVSIEILNSNLETQEELNEIPLDFSYNVKRDGEGNLVKDEEGNIIFEATKLEQIINLPLVISGNEKIDLANKENIKITYRTTSLAPSNQEKIYNDDDIIGRDIEVKSLFEVIEKGFNTGRTSGEIVQGVDSSTEPISLAIENSFGLAFKIDLKGATDTSEVYISNNLGGKITAIKKDTLSLGDNIYVIRIDCKIGIVPIGEHIEVGFKIGETIEKIKIKTVEKPEHF